MAISPEERLKAEKKVSMSSEPGRIHNLTDTEEQKLMQMWSHVLVAIGVAPETLRPSRTLSSLNGSDKKSSSSGSGWFGRKKDTSNSDEMAESEKGIQATRDALKKELGPVKPEELNHTLWKMFRGDNPDNLLLRFLRARKWNVHDAVVMLSETLKWRFDYGVESIIEGGEERIREKKEDGVLLQFKAGKCYVWGHDMKGRPIVHVRPRLHDPKAQTEEDVEKFTIMIIEASRLCLHDYVDTAATIFDLSGFGLGNMDYSAVKFIIKCFEGHYPESLGFLLIHKAPWIFQGIWNIIKGWIDPVVASKISFTRNHNDMTKFITDENIPKELGGKREYEYEYIEPVEGENDKVGDSEAYKQIDDQRFKWGREFEEATLEWINSEKDADRKAAQAKKNELAEKIRKSYWEFDQYNRRKTVFDRNGLFKTFHPELRGKKTENGGTVKENGAEGAVVNEKEAGEEKTE